MGTAMPKLIKDIDIRELVNSFLQQRYKNTPLGTHTTTIALHTGPCTIAQFSLKIEMPIQDYCTQHKFTFRTITEISPPSEDGMRSITFTYDTPDEIEN